MKRLVVLLVVATTTLGGASAQTDGVAPAASAPATPYKRVKPLPPPEPTAVQRSKQATIPGDFRPERQTVPQIRLPLGKGSYQAGPSSGGIDDSVARCRAKRTSEEREACEASLDNI
jgi:hypothetical protein